MSLHPIETLNAVITEYRDFLTSEFRAKDPALRQALEAELDKPLFLTQEPFYQAHRPFRKGARWSDLPIAPELAKALQDRSKSEHAYQHQSDAITHLLGPDASSLVVTTGTGSGKSECFLLPVIQNAIQDAATFNKRGVTAIIVYPMNALANDQLLRIEEYLEATGVQGKVKVAKYDRGTAESDRQSLRENPPHILLTNYMMLEYLLVRPNDRESIFANHRCRFLVFDEVHSYRGALGSNIALLVRRVRAHLKKARQDWGTDQTTEKNQERRHPKLLAVGTSATIKSVSNDLPPEQRIALRDETVREFFHRVSGEPKDSIRVLGEVLQESPIPEYASFSTKAPEYVGNVDIEDPDSVRLALIQSAGIHVISPIEQAAAHCKLLWLLNHWLIGSPQSLQQLALRVQQEVPERNGASLEAITKEVENVLIAGAALPEGAPNTLRLRAHRFIRGGWKFMRCTDTACGRVFPMGEENCECGRPTAPLYLCRSCGADYLRLDGNPDDETLQPFKGNSAEGGWMLYEQGRFEESADSDDESEEETQKHTASTQRIKRVGKEEILDGSLDAKTLKFSKDANDYPLKVRLVPSLKRCVCCGGTAGSRNVLTPVALGTSAAIKVLSEGLVESLAIANADKPGHDAKERVLIFSDSRQDASHQARFITFASRYDRMRRRIVALLDASPDAKLSIQQAVDRLGELGVQQKDNPHAPKEDESWIPDDQRSRIKAYEEAPLLDDIAVTAGFRATIINLGIVTISYNQLEDYIAQRGQDLLHRWGLQPEQLQHICRTVLDEVRIRGMLNREALQYHPLNQRYPEHCRAANWERRLKAPKGLACPGGIPVPYIDLDAIPRGIQASNFWRKPKTGGKGPKFQAIFQHLGRRFGCPDFTEDDGLALLKFLVAGKFIVPSDLFGSTKRETLLQLNNEIVRLQLTKEANRFRCSVCSTPLAGAYLDAPCPRCHGKAKTWTDNEVNQHRMVGRLRSDTFLPLFAAEHTAQVPNAKRVDIEERFKAPAKDDPLNVLACSPTMEMGIDVGGLDAVLMRNVPPRPDNYAQRGGRAGRRTRVGLVIGYARRNPHDQYFYDHPEEMISGDIPAPALSLGNRDILLRHLNAIAFGAAQPGLAGKMLEYISTTGDIVTDKVEALKTAVANQAGYALQIAKLAWGENILPASGLTDDDLKTHLDNLPQRIQDVMERTSKQVKELRQALDRYATDLVGQQPGNRAGDLVTRLLGIPVKNRKGGGEADDTSAGYPLRRFAEFGILPGYEFPAEPAAVRLLGDANEEEPITANRRVGIYQFMPEAAVYARNRRWKVIGLDTASPWNPRTDAPWDYRICKDCSLHYAKDEPKCLRCGKTDEGKPYPAHEFGGFLAITQETPIMDEEDRIAARNLVTCHPQSNGLVQGRWSVGPGWRLTHTTNEEVRWLNEGFPPKGKNPNQEEILHNLAEGFPLCPNCGRLLKFPDDMDGKDGHRKQARKAQKADQDPYGHSEQCAQKGQKPVPSAIATSQRSEILRLEAWLPADISETDEKEWAYSLGHALLAGIRRLYLLDDREMDLVIEGPWKQPSDICPFKQVRISFIDPSLGGSGYLGRIAKEFHLVAKKAKEHLEHPNCQRACYRCLKSYGNQGIHEFLNWPRIIADLNQLADSPPTELPKTAADAQDPKPWLDAYKEGVGSPLELQFWNLFLKHGFTPDKQVPVGIGAEPISVADFGIPSARLAIYIDGAAFHVGNRLRRDRFIRAQLRSADPAWTVIELTAHDLAKGKQVVDSIKAAAGI